jgi:HPt (histidine-containing phosphotransfer) domain-containing protein
MSNIETNTSNHIDPTSEKLYNMSMIERLCHQNKELIKKLVKVFIDEVPEAVEDIKIAYKNRDYVVIKNTAHRIKPTIAYYNIVKLEKNIQEIEVLALEEMESEDFELKIIKLNILVDQVVKELKNEFYNN